MPGSPYYLANTFSHLLGGLIVTGISVENGVFSKLGEKPITNLAFVLTALPFLYLTYITDPSPLKYLLFIITCFILGQSLNGLANRLEMENELSTVLLNTSVLFGTISVVGLLDSRNVLGWGLYLSVSLISLITFNVLSYFSKTDKKRSLINILLSYLTIALFVLFVGFDIEVIKEHALNNINPDYINESMNLYLDFLTLFIGLGQTR
jgi:FtsH-binding integral membrane protein